MSRPGDQFRLQAGGADQLLVADRRAEVGEQAQVLAQAQDGLLGAQRALQLVVLPVADGAEQHGVGFLGQLERGIGQRMAVGLVGGAADQGGFHLELQVEDVEDLDGLGDDLGADAVARQNCDFHVFVSQRLRVWASQGFLARRSASKALILSVWRRVRPMSSKPLIRQYLRKGCTSKASSSPWGLTTTWRSRSMVSW